jgi:hypothetical protein
MIARKLFQCPKTNWDLKKFLMQYLNLMKQVNPKALTQQLDYSYMNDFGKILGVSMLSMRNYARGTKGLNNSFIVKICTFVKGLNDGATRKPPSITKYVERKPLVRYRRILSSRQTEKIYNSAYAIGETIPTNLDPKWKKPAENRSKKPYRRLWIGATNLRGALRRVKDRYGITTSDLSKALDTPIQRIMKWRGYTGYPGTKSWKFENKLKNYIAGFQAASEGVSERDLQLNFNELYPPEFEKEFLKGYYDARKAKKRRPKASGLTRASKICKGCRRKLEPSWVACPYCGKKRRES